MEQFIDILRQEIEYIYKGGTYKVVVDEGDIEVWHLTDDTVYDGVDTDPTAWYLLDENDWETWVGALIWHYENDNGPEGPANCWVEGDYTRAAQMCAIVGYVIPARKLEWICGIRSLWNDPCHDYETAKRYLELYLEGNANNQAFREGAD